MKYFSLIFFLQIITIGLFAQTPQSFQYQAVVRDASGNALVSQPVNFRVSIISGSMTGTVEYVETHNSTTNAYGIVTLNIGSGTATTGTFTAINWGISSHFIKVEADPTGGTSYLDMGTTQLLSVPYSLYSEKAGNIPVYTGGAGINVTGTTITNTSPDQTLNLTQGGATTISGTYPNFTISSTDNNTTYTAGTGINVTGTTITNTSPDQTVTLTQGGSTTVSGTYPNFTISSTDLNTGTPGGLNKTVQFNNSGSFGGDTAMIWDNTNKRLGVGVTNPNGRMVIRGSSTALATEPLFEVKNAAGQTVFVVYPDSVHIYVKDGGAKSNKGGFAVSGRNNSKAFTNNFLSVTPDSTRIFTGDTISGFGVENLGGGSSTSYMHLTPNNYFIGHQAGDSITTGLYNSFLGFQSGKNNTTGSYNVFTGYKSGYTNIGGNYNTFIGFKSGYTNTGNDNTFLGFEAGSSHLGGGGNVYIGSKAGQYDQNGQQNIFIGENSGINNQTGSQNIFLGYASGYNNNGSYNVSLGYESGYNNTYGSNNTFLGYQSGRNNVNGASNVLLGNQAGFNNNGGSNVMLGYLSGYNNASGNSNVMIGTMSGYNNTTGSSNTFIGENAGYSNLDGVSNVFIGNNAGVSNTSGYSNSFIGYNCGYYNTTGYWNAFYGMYAGYNNQTGVYNTFLGPEAGLNSTSGSNNTYLGNMAGKNANGNNNVFIGRFAGYNETGSDKLYIDNGWNGGWPLIGGDFVSRKVGINRMPTTYTLEVGGTIWANGATISNGATTWSDARYKKNIKTLENALVNICKLRGVSYDWRRDEFPDKNFSEGLQIGVIAQEVEKIYPELVVTGADGYKTVSYEKLSPILLEAVKQLNEKVETLMKENAELKEKVNDIDKLKAEIGNLNSEFSESARK